MVQPSAFLTWQSLDAYAWLQTPVWAFDVEALRMLWANPAALRLWHAGSLDDLLNRDFSDTSPHTRARFAAVMEAARRGESVHMMWTIYPAGEPITLEINRRGLLLPDGRLAMLSEARALGADALPATLRRDLEALNQTHAQISVHRPDGSAMMRNSAAVLAFGSVQDQIAADDLALQVGGVDNAAALRQAVAGGSTFTTRARVTSRLGMRWHELFARRMRDPVSGGDALLLSAEDVTEKQAAERRLAAEKQMLELISSARPLTEVLDRLTRVIEEESSGMLCSVLLIDGERRFRIGAAPNLPAAYNAALEGIPAEEGLGSCGTAAARGERVVVDDIARDPLWEPFRTLAVSHGLRACCSVPIVGVDGQVVATFGAYLSEPRAPNADELRLLESARHIASIAIERARAADALSQRERHLTAVVDSVPALICFCDPSSRYVYANQRYANWMRISRDALVGKHLADVLGGDIYRMIEPHVQQVLAGHEVRYERRHRDEDGSAKDFEAQYVPHFAPDGTVSGFLAMLKDVTERKRDEEMLYFLANHDQLTSLPNRNLFLEHLNKAIAQAARAGEKVAVLFIDLDRFKNVNDTLGHPVGDALLQQVARRLSACLRDSDVIARLGGDEYTVMVGPVDDLQDVAACAQKLLNAFISPFEVNGHDLFVTGSVGISVYPDDARDATALLKNADIAMYHSKEQGANCYQFFSPEVTAATLEHLMLETSLRRALEREEFVLHFQPIVDLQERRTTGMETLIRWQRPEIGMVPPARFIPLAEETGLIVPIGQWVLEQACRQVKDLHRQGFDRLRVAVNLSPKQFRQRDLVRNIARVLDQLGLDPDCLELEVTESSVMEDADSAIRTLHDLKDMGVHLSIDDFGTGYSSLSYLKRFPIDALKVDQSFVRNVTTNAEDAAITSAVIAMGHSLRLTLIAEGVENEGQLRFLREQRCEKAQGYLFSRPVPADGIADFLQTHERTSVVRH